MATEPVKVPFFKKGKSRPTTSRKRSVSPSNKSSRIAGSSKSEVILPSRKAASNLLTSGTKRTASQRLSDELDEKPESEGPDIKWTASGSHLNTALEILAGDEAEELLAKRMKKEKADRGEEDEDIQDDGLYRGQKAYRSHLKKSTEVPKAMRVGPQRSTDNTIKTVTIVDYQPDVCKDYKGVHFAHHSLCRGTDNVVLLYRNWVLWIWRYM
jgi:RING finger protein 113A